jgi:ribonucleotide reductase beta subunit family protein with ferritin-like domain
MSNLIKNTYQDLSNNINSKSPSSKDWKNILKHDINHIIDNIPDNCNDKQSFLNSLVNNIKDKYNDVQFDRILLCDKDKDEPLLNPNKRTFIAPIKPEYPVIWNYYKTQMALFWKVEELDFSNDYNDFMTLNKDEQHFIEMILAFFAASDGIVNFNLSERFTREITNPETLYAYQFQMMMESIHSNTYAIMLENIVKDKQRQQYLFDAIQNVSSVKLMSQWALKWIDSSESFAHRIVAFAIVEGIFFSGAFAAIYWLDRYKNVDTEKKSFMNGFIKSNEFIARDEGLHLNMACELYKHVVNKLSTKQMNSIMREAVEIAKIFMTDALPIRMIGMNETMMCNYIQYVSDRLLNMLGYKKIYNSKNPFKFMETIGLLNKGNFFEERVTGYQDADILNKTKTKRFTRNRNF